MFYNLAYILPKPVRDRSSKVEDLRWKSIIYEQNAFSIAEFGIKPLVQAGGFFFSDAWFSIPVSGMLSSRSYADAKKIPRSGFFLQKIKSTAEIHS